MRALLALACGGGQVGLGLRQLLIQFGSGDHGQQRALLHPGADVEVPVQSGSRRCGHRWANRYRRSRCRAAQSSPPARPAWAGQRHRGRGQLVVRSASTVSACMRRRMPSAASTRQDEQNHDHADQSLARRDGLLLGRGSRGCARRGLRIRIGFVGHKHLLRSLVELVECRWRMRNRGPLCAGARCQP